MNESEKHFAGYYGSSAAAARTVEAKGFAGNENLVPGYAEGFICVHSLSRLDRAMQDGQALMQPGDQEFAVVHVGFPSRKLGPEAQTEPFRVAYGDLSVRSVMYFPLKNA